MVKFSLDSGVATRRLRSLMEKAPYTVMHDAVVKNVKQLMFWIIAGSPRESIKPPIDTGDLRAKVFAIVDGKRYPLEAGLAAKAKKRFMNSKKAATQYYSDK